MKYRASKLIVKHVDKKTERDFLNVNHRQGAITSTVAIGLFDGDELIQIETFGQPRIEMQNKSIQHQWELLRECSKKDCQVHGGKSRLLKHFIEEYEPVSILSYCSLTEGFDGHSYSACGFTKISESKSYHYEFNGQKIQRYKMQKNSNLRAQGLKEPIEKTLDSFDKDYDPSLSEFENATRAGFQKIDDIGNQVWEMKFAKYVGYIYEFELEGKKYRGKHIVNGKPYYGSGTAWKAWCNSIPNYKKKLSIKILKWLADDSIEALDTKLIESETKYIQEILGREDYLNISDNKMVSNYVNCHNPISNANRARTIANRTPEQRAETKRKHFETISNWSEEKKAQIGRNISESLSNRSSEEKDESERKRIETISNWSEEKKYAVKKKRSETIANRSKEKRAQIGRKISNAYFHKTPEEKAKINKKISETKANWSEEKKYAVKKKLSETRALKTPEEKAKIVRKYQETMSKKSQEEKAEISKHISEGCKNSEKVKKRNEKKLNEKIEFLNAYFDKVEKISNSKYRCFKDDKSINVFFHGWSLTRIKKHLEIKGF